MVNDDVNRSPISDERFSARLRQVFKKKPKRRSIYKLAIPFHSSIRERKKKEEEEEEPLPEQLSPKLSTSYAIN